MKTTIRAGRQCTVCAHAARALIEDRLAIGASSFRGIARDFDVSPDAVRRHLHGHLDPALHEAAREGAGLGAVSVARRVLDIANSARAIRLEAEDAGAAGMTLRAGDAEVRALTSLADRFGIREGDALRDLSDTDDLVRAIRRAVRADGRFGAALVHALIALDRPDLADALQTTLDRKEITK